LALRGTAREDIRTAQGESMHVTVCVCTRDRGSRISRTIQSLKGLAGTDFDVIVVDQSSDGETESVVHSAIADDDRFAYFHVSSSGVSRARNTAISRARGPIIAFTDDDCQVASDWLATLVEFFGAYPLVGAIFGEVLPAPHEPHAGFIPEYPVTSLRLISSPRAKWREGGIGANMAFRLEALHAAGPFDVMLGPGAPLPSCEEGDMSYRILRSGYSVLNVPGACVTHHGFRTWAEGSDMLRKTGQAVAAAYMKHLRAGDVAILPTLLIEACRTISYSRLLRLRPRPGVTRFFGYLGGIRDSFRYPVDREHRLYALNEDEHRWEDSGGAAWHSVDKDRLEARRTSIPSNEFAPGEWVKVGPRTKAAVTDDLEVSIVLPTHGRRDSLVRVLRALARQSVPCDRFEVVVVCDGDVDGSEAAIRSLTRELPFELVIISQTNQGPAAARNSGVRAARAPLILFIDDDVVPDGALVASHLEAHARQGSRVAIGPLLPPPDARLSLWGKYEERMLCRQYDAMAAGVFQPTFRQFYTGNASVLKVHLLELGGFDPAFRRAEDVELAYRLRERGLHFVFVPEARGWHYVSRSFDSWLGLPVAYGEADVAMARAGHGWAVEVAAENYRARSAGVRAMVRACAGGSRRYRFALGLLQALARAAEATRPPGGYILCSLIWNLSYFDSVIQTLGDRDSFRDLVRGHRIALTADARADTA
jgi:glycosyltransferase involved in cell wall biosynthesis